MSRILDEMRENGTTLMLNPTTCGIYKNGASRFKLDKSGKRSSEIDNQLTEHVAAIRAGKMPPGAAIVDRSEPYRNRDFTPAYYDLRSTNEFVTAAASSGLATITIGELADSGLIQLRFGHGSPSNDMRQGAIPYIKVSDLRALRLNVNPTNLVSESVAVRHWKGNRSGLQAWDLLTPIRASANIGEFVILLPGEERVVLTKEILVVRSRSEIYSPFFLLWALSLKSVRLQWRRAVHMQTNREDVGNRYRSILLPAPSDQHHAEALSQPFKEFFEGVDKLSKGFLRSLSSSPFEYTSNVRTTSVAFEGNEDTAEIQDDVDSFTEQ